MGSLPSKKSKTYEDDYKSVYRVKAKETAAMKKVWLIVENDLSYYGSIFSTILFRNHPRYMKYFHEDKIPEFVQDARIKKKFSAVCTTVSALFIDYSKKRQQRDHLLGYIAMIHKDMQLTPQDLENFMTDLLEMLIQECPKEMTADCTVVHTRYFGGLLNRIGYLMEVQREKDLYRLEDEPSERLCGWMTPCDPPSIYGRSIDYWIAKKQYWQVRMAVWSSVDTELSVMSSFLTTKRIDKKAHRSESIEHGFGRRPSSPVANDGRSPWLKPSRHLRSIADTTSESSCNDVHRIADNSLHNRTMIWYERCKRVGRRYRRNGSSLSSPQRMEPIPEVRSRQTIATPLKSSMKNSRVFLDVANDFKTARVNIESEKISTGSPIKHKTTIDTARARKRRRDRKGRTAAYKKGNTIHPDTVSNDDEDDIEDT